MEVPFVVLASKSTSKLSAEQTDAHQSPWQQQSRPARPILTAQLQEVTGCGESDDLLSLAPPSSSHLAPSLLGEGRSGSPPSLQHTGAPAVCQGIRSVLLQSCCLGAWHTVIGQKLVMSKCMKTARATWELLNIQMLSPS